MINEVFGTLFINWYVKLAHTHKIRFQVDVAYLKLNK